MKKILGAGIASHRNNIAASKTRASSPSDPAGGLGDGFSHQFPFESGAGSLHDHYTVISTEGDRRHTRTVIAASETDAKKTHREHYPTCTVIAAVANIADIYDG